METLIIANEKGSQYAAKHKAVAIVVDTLRASTTLPVLMNKGIKTLYIAKEVAAARSAASKYNALLMGERGCKKLPGFDFGNSPSEIFKLQTLSNEVASFTTSTGTRRVIEAIGSSFVLIGSPINANSVAKKALDLLQQLDEVKLKIVIIPAFSLGSILKHELTEDQIGGLIIARELKKEGAILEQGILEELDYLERKMAEKTLFDLLLATEHGQKLVELGFKNDIAFCSQLNELNEVPLSKNEVVELDKQYKVMKFQ